MPKEFKVTDDVFIEALGPDEAQDSLVCIVFHDYPDTQSIPIYVGKIKALIAALTEAAVWLADQVGE